MATLRPGFIGTDTDNVAVEPFTKKDDYDPEKVDIDSKVHSPEINYLDESLPEFDASKEDHFGEVAVLSDAKDLLTHVIHVDDDPTLSPWTFRAFFIGI